MGVFFKLLLDQIRLLNIVTNFWFNPTWYLILFAHLMENFQFFLFRVLIFPNRANQSPHITDIICQGYTTESFNKHQNYRLDMVCGCKIPEANSQHDIGSPIVTPNILYIPNSIFNPNFYMPIIGSFNPRHHIECHWQEMPNRKVS